MIRTTADVYVLQDKDNEEKLYAYYDGEGRHECGLGSATVLYSQAEARRALKSKSGLANRYKSAKLTEVMFRIMMRSLTK